jgi:Mg-chelatase subunit ChlD
MSRAASSGNNLELNEGDNFIFGIDVSGSMATTDCPGGMSRIEFLKEKAIQFAQKASEFDTDGIDVIAFGHKVDVHKGVTGAKAGEIIGGLKADQASTDTSGLIRKAWDLHKAGGYEQTVLFICTDGAPASKSAVAEAIREIASLVKDPREFNISILTVGEIDPGLRDFLTMLDDDLKAKHDIVDVKALTDVDFMTAFVGATND